MSYQSIPLLAGRPHRLDIAGRLILVDTVGDSDGVDIEILLAGSTKTTTMPRRKAGFRLVQAYDGVILTSAVDARIGIFLSENDVQLGTVDGAAVTIPGGVVVNNGPGNPVSVAFDNDINIGTVQVENDCRTIVDMAPVAVGLVATSVSNDPDLKKIRFRNMSTLALICIGGPSVNMGSPIILQPGDTYFEDDAAAAHIYAIASDNTAFLQIQGLKR
ncbi:hypothetical protein ACL9RI_25415 [Janthinobacterium sp. Mn2066]|uniref:hypothetical protein n=1 Tax=Janthinobacterium sp. Mn2066 TaxID=3395264 RepID=UPI003BBBD62E